MWSTDYHISLLAVTFIVCHAKLSMHGDLGTPWLPFLQYWNCTCQVRSYLIMLWCMSDMACISIRQAPFHQLCTLISTACRALQRVSGISCWWRYIVDKVDTPYGYVSHSGTAAQPNIPSGNCPWMAGGITYFCPRLYLPLRLPSFVILPLIDVDMSNMPPFPGL